MTRNEAIQIGVTSLKRWHALDHGDDCGRAESEQFERRSAAVIDRMTSDGIFVLQSTLEERSYQHLRSKL